MSSIKTRFQRFRYKLKFDYFTFNNVVSVLAVVMGVVWTWGAIASVTRNWELAQQLTNNKRQVEVLKLETENLQLENDFYKTPEYQELSARRLQNKKFPGETMVYLPDNSETAKNKHQNASASTTIASSNNYNNFDQWMMFLFGNNQQPN